jgi:hypothetical protein
MSIKLFYNQLENALQFNTIQSQLKITNGTNTIIHKFDQLGNYDVSHSDGTDLISFNPSKQLTSDCVLAQHIQTGISATNRIVSGHTTTLASHSTALDDHEVRLGTIESSTESSENIEQLNTRIQTLENYITELKLFISAFKETIYISDESGENEFNYNNILN